MLLGGLGIGFGCGVLVVVFLAGVVVGWLNLWWCFGGFGLWCFGVLIYRFSAPGWFWWIWLGLRFSWGWYSILSGAFVGSLVCGWGLTLRGGGGLGWRFWVRGVSGGLALVMPSALRFAGFGWLWIWWLWCFAVLIYRFSVSVCWYCGIAWVCGFLVGLV